MDVLLSWLRLPWNDLVFYAKALISVGAIGTLWELFNWLRERRKEARESAEAAEQLRIEAYNDGYRALSDRYVALLTSLVQHPELGVLPWMDSAAKLSAADIARRSIYFEMLMSIFESAWVNRDRTDEIAKYQWPGWERFIISMLRSPHFREHVSKDPSSEEFGGYDQRFEAYLDDLLSKHGVATPVISGAAGRKR